MMFNPRAHISSQGCAAIIKCFVRAKAQMVTDYEFPQTFTVWQNQNAILLWLYFKAWRPIPSWLTPVKQPETYCCILAINMPLLEIKLQQSYNAQYTLAHKLYVYTQTYRHSFWRKRTVSTDKGYSLYSCGKVYVYVCVPYSTSERSSQFLIK